MKLNLIEFGQWVNKELVRYTDVPVSAIPEYRKLYGTPEALNTIRGWMTIRFQSAKEEHICSIAPIGISVPEIEQALNKPDRYGYFVCDYPPEIKHSIMQTINYGDDLRIRVATSKVFGILEAVRNIVLSWTLEMEQSGVLGEGLMFTKDDKAKSAEIASHTITTFNIQQVGALVQHATDSEFMGKLRPQILLLHRRSNLYPSLRRFLRHQIFLLQPQMTRAEQSVN